MLARFQHQFKLVAPLLGPLSILVFLGSLGFIWSTRQMGDGLDALTATLAVPQWSVSAWLESHWIVVAAIALIATTIMASSVLRHLHTHKKRMTHIERIALWSGIVTVPMAYLIAPNIFGLPLAIIFGLALIARTR
jgi:hypothetical protein